MTQSLTEAQAKTKWCPFSRTGVYTDRGEIMAVTTNRDPRPEIQESCNCIASSCMAWSWGNISNSSGTTISPSTEYGYCRLMK